MEAYKIKADFEAKEMHDWNSAKLYSEKALAAIEGQNIKPEKINYWKIPTEQVKELQKAYENLMIIYNDAIIAKPYHLALAISSLDCWSEQQEENWQTWDIKKCKEDFLNAMHQIYNALETQNQENQLNKELSTDSVSVVTKNDKDEVLQIIYFDFDKSNLTDVSIKSIKNYINKNKSISKFIIVGHTDTKGTKKYNLSLSIKRAEVVKEILVNYGIDQSIIKILGKGEESLALDTPDDTKQPANRRVEIKKTN